MTFLMNSSSPTSKRSAGTSPKKSSLKEKGDEIKQRLDDVLHDIDEALGVVSGDACQRSFHWPPLLGAG